MSEFVDGRDLEWRLPAGRAFIITDEIGTELFRVSAAGDAVKVSGQVIDPAALAELSALDGVTATAAQLNYTAVTSVGTVQASKAVVVDANKDAAAFRNLGAVNLDAGSDGVAGTVDVFPATASSGKLAVSVTNQAGDTTVGLVVGAMAAARTITLADPLANADILTGRMAAVARTASADGLTTGTIADAGLMQFVTVTSGNADHIIVLPTPTPGRVVMLANGGTGYELRSSAPATVAINGGSGADAESAIAANTLVWAVCTSATTWQAWGIAAAVLAAVEAAA